MSSRHTGETVESRISYVRHGGTGIDVTSASPGDWELLQTTVGGSPVNEVILDAMDALGADFYVDGIVIRPR